MENKKQENIGLLIKRKRKEKKLTLEDVAKAVNVGKSTVSKWERGAILNMKRDKIQSLCDILGIPPITFINGIDDPDELEELTREQFKYKVSLMIYRCTDLTEQEKNILRSVVSNL